MNINFTKFIVLLSILLLTIEFIYAIDYDLKLTTNISDSLNTSVNYTKLFKIQNINHTSGQSENIHVFVSYNITNVSDLIKNDVFDVYVNSYTTTNTGNILFDYSGNYILCGIILNSTYNNSINNDPDTNNNFECKNIFVSGRDLIINETNQTNQTINETQNETQNQTNNQTNTTNNCDIYINITSEKIIYNNKETIYFYNLLNNSDYDYSIEYWIEDLFGNIIKSRRNTSNIDRKSYTPDVDDKDKVLLVKNRIVYLNCNNINNNTASEKLIVVKNPSYNYECPECECETEKTAKESKQSSELCSNIKEMLDKKQKNTTNAEENKIISFYTRNKNYNDEINFYIKLDKKENATIRFITMNKVQDYEINDDNITLKTNLSKGNNIFIAELLDGNKTVDTKYLLFYANETINEVNSFEAFADYDFENQNTINETKKNQITGNVVYESSNKKAMNYAVFAIVFIVCLLIALFLKHKFKKKDL